MQFRDFCYWLQGHFELNKSNQLTPSQVEEIRKHLYVCFQHECETWTYDGDKQAWTKAIGSPPPLPQLLCDVTEFKHASDVGLVRFPDGPPGSC